MDKEALHALHPLVRDLRRLIPKFLSRDVSRSFSRVAMSRRLYKHLDRKTCL